MFVFLFIKLFDRLKADNTGVLWCGAGFALLLDAFLISVLVYWLRALQT